MPGPPAVLPLGAGVQSGTVSRRRLRRRPDALTALEERLANIPLRRATPQQPGSDRAFAALTAVQDSLIGGDK
jgi:hypothetical protein